MSTSVRDTLSLEGCTLPEDEDELSLYFSRHAV